MSENKTVEILLSVYGKADFLGEFLQSLQGQDCQDFRLLYRFDGNAASDAEELLKKFPRSEEIPGREHLGVVFSYQKLLKNSSAELVMFADQDDIWHRDKISRSVEAIQKEEEKWGKEIPVLVHTDLRVVDHAKQPICASLWDFQVLNPQKNSLKALMIQNNVTGCTMIFNRALADLMDEFPDAAICHDWYLAMTASALGKIAFLNRPTIDYRQHAGNVFGAVPRRKFTGMLWQRRHLHERLALTQRQAQAFLTQFRGKLMPDQVKILEVWGRNLPQKRYWRRLLLAWHHHFCKNDFWRTLGMWWAL